MSESQTVEVMIRDVVYDAAFARARSQVQPLRSIAREILFDRAAQSEPIDQAAQPSGRVLLSHDRVRLRFQAPRVDYQKARARLHASGVSVTAAVEEGLERFARTGQFRDI